MKKNKESCQYWGFRSQTRFADAICFHLYNGQSRYAPRQTSKVKVTDMFERSTTRIHIELFEISPSFMDIIIYLNLWKCVKFTDKVKYSNCATCLVNITRPIDSRYMFRYMTDLYLRKCITYGAGDDTSIEKNYWAWRSASRYAQDQIFNIKIFTRENSVMNSSKKKRVTMFSCQCHNGQIVHLYIRKAFARKLYQ